MSLLVRQVNQAGQFVISTNSTPKLGGCTCSVPMHTAWLISPYKIKCTGKRIGARFEGPSKRDCTTEFCLLCYQHMKYHDVVTGREFYFVEGFFPIALILIRRAGPVYKVMCVDCDLFFQRRKFEVNKIRLTETDVKRTKFDKFALTGQPDLWCTSETIQHQEIIRSREFAFQVQKDPTIVANYPRYWHSE